MSLIACLFRGGLGRKYIKMEGGEVEILKTIKKVEVNIVIDNAVGF